MPRVFSSIDDVRRSAPPSVRDILLADLQPEPDACRGFRDLLECADATAVLIEPGDDIHHLGEAGGERDLTDLAGMYYERVEIIGGGRMVVAAEVGTIYYLPAELLSPGDLALFRSGGRSRER